MKNYCLLGFCELKKNVTKLIISFIFFPFIIPFVLTLFLQVYTRPSYLTFIVILGTIFKELMCSVLNLGREYNQFSSLRSRKIRQGDRFLIESGIKFKHTF